MFDVLSLIGGGLGGALRIVPEVMKLVNAKSDQKHELDMTRLQLEIDKSRSDGAISLVHAQEGAAQSAGDLAAYVESIKSQGQLTGVKWIDAINSTVRPFLTYWWMAIFSAYKVSVIYDAWTTSVTTKEFGARIWDANDWGILSMITMYWFVGRVFDAKK